MPMIEFFVATHHQKERLFIKFPQNATIHAVLKDFYRLTMELFRVYLSLH